MRTTTTVMLAVKTAIIVAAMVVSAENHEHLLPDSFPDPSIGALFRWSVPDQGLMRLQSSCRSV